MQRSLKEEVKFLEDKLEKNPYSVLFARLADAYLQLERIDEAITMCEEGIKKHPYYVTGHYILGKCYLKKKLFDQAEKELKRVLLFDSKYLAAHRDYGELMAQIGWGNTCEMSYDEILKIDPLNDKAKQRFAEIKSTITMTSENSVKPEPSVEYDDLEEDIMEELPEENEEDILSTVSPDFNDEKDIFEEAPNIDLEDSIKSDEVIETELPHEDEERANMDLLEDIFRDETTSGLDLEEENPIDEYQEAEEGHEESAFNFNDDLDEMDLSQFTDQDSDQDEFGEFNSKGFEELDDDELYSLISDEKEGTIDTSEFEFDETPKNGHGTQYNDDTVTEEHESFDDAEDEISEPEPVLNRTSLSDVETGQIMSDDLSPTVNQSENTHENESLADLEAEFKRKEKIVTPTLGEIYAAQHQYSKAIGVYEILKKKDPDNQMYTQKIEYLQRKLEESQSE